MTWLDKYPNTDVIERYFILKLFRNENVRKRFLPIILPQLFLDKKRRYVCYIMKMLHATGGIVTPDNIILMTKSPTEDMMLFKKKHKIPEIGENEIYDMAHDTTIDTRNDLVDVAYKQLQSNAFKRFVTDALYEMEKANEEYKRSVIVAKSKGIVKVHDLIYNKLMNPTRDQIAEAMEYINNPNEYIWTSSSELNRVMGGFTRGYVDTIGAKSGHTKSSWTDANALYNLLNGHVNKVLVITPEESAAVRWRRIFASVCKIPISSLRQKRTLITEEHVKIVRDKLEGKLIYVDDVAKYADIIKLMKSIDADVIYIDHLQSIIYPGRGSALDNMIGNIPGLVNFEKIIAREKNIPIINLSQVNDKTIQRSDRLVKAPRYWDLYGSSILYQAARELLMLWYPIKDYEKLTALGGATPTIHDVELRIEKSSYTSNALIKLYFDPDYNIFMDSPSGNNETNFDINQMEIL